MYNPGLKHLDKTWKLVRFSFFLPLSLFQCCDFSINFHLWSMLNKQPHTSTVQWSSIGGGWRGGGTDIISFDVDIVYEGVVCVLVPGIFGHDCSFLMNLKATRITPKTRAIKYCGLLWQLGWSINPSNTNGQKTGRQDKQIVLQLVGQSLACFSRKHWTAG